MKALPKRHVLFFASFLALALTLGLGLLAHRVFKVLGQYDVTNLDRLHRDSPWVGLLVQDRLELVAQRLTLTEQLGKLMRPDDIPQGRLSREHNR